MNSCKDKITGIARLALVLLASFVLVSCGGGGGGQNPSSTPTNSVNAVINQSGGAIALPDGTSVTLVAGLVKDGTNVTITSTAQPTSVPTQEVQALSPTVVIDIPPDSLIASAPAGSAITIEIPLTGNMANNLVAGLSTAGVLGAVNNVVQVTVESVGIGGEIVTYYAPLILKSPGKIAVTIGKSVLCKAAVGGLVCLGAKAIVGGYNVTQCTKQSTSLYQVDFLNSMPVFGTNILRNGKPPLILVHGWQEAGVVALAISGGIVGGCNKPYSSTWQAFLKEYSLDPAISDKFQVFSLAYSTSNPVFGGVVDGVVGSDFARIIAGQFGQDAVYVVAHSMGGLVARSALVNHGANIGGLVTLATPHHGTPVASQEGVDLFGGTPLYPLIDYVIGGEGIMDLAWDNFDGWLQPPYHDKRGNVGNPPLEALNAKDTYHGRYVVFAGIDNEPFIGAIINNLGYQNDGYQNDAVVPLSSALLYNSNNAIDSRLKLQKSFVGLSHFTITSDGGVLSDTRAALLGFLNAPPLPPAAPTGISATAAGNGQATISWNAVAGVTYNLYMASVSGVTKSNFSSLTDGMQHVGVTSPYTHTGLTNGKPYYFVVTAVNGYGEGSESIQVSVTPQALPVVTLTASPSSIAYGATSTLSWSSTNSTSCTSTGGGGTGTAGSFTTPALTATTTYTVTCTGAGGTASQSATVTVAATPLTYSISGSAGLSGVTMTLSGASSGGATTDANGNYTFVNLANGSYTIAPALSGYSFTPSSLVITVSGANITAANFTATSQSGTLYSITGTVTASGYALSGVTMTLSGANSGAYTTDANGMYGFALLANGSYTVTPALSGYIFTPTSSPITISGTNIMGANFYATATASTLPTATTGSATNIIASTDGFTYSATLNGTVNPNGISTGGYFQLDPYGTFTTYTSTQVLGSGTSNVAVTAGVTGLSANTTYYFRIVAINSLGETVFGASQSLTAATVVTSGCSESGDFPNSSLSAYPLTLNVGCTGYISPTGDEDWFTVYKYAGTTMSFQLTVPSGIDYDMELYGPDSSNSSPHWLANCYPNTYCNGAGQTDFITSYTTTATGYFFVRVIGYSGASSSTSIYTITRSQ